MSLVEPVPAQVGVVVVPGDDEAAGGQAGDIGLVLAAEGGLVDQQLGADLGAGGIEALGDDGGGGAVQGVIAPDDDEAAVGQGGHGRFVLVAGGGGVDEEGVGKDARGAVEGAAVDAVQVAVVAALVGPDHDQVAIGERGDVRRVLRARLGGAGRAGRGADARLGAHRVAGEVEAAQLDVGAAGVNNGIAVGVAGHCAVRLRAGGGEVDDDVAALRGTGRVVALADHTGAGAIDAAGVVPGDDEAAVAGGGDMRVVLRAGGGGVDAELAAERDAGVGVALGIDAGAVAILARGGPGDDIAAVGQHRDVRRRLVARGVGVDGLVGMDDRHAVELVDDVDGDGVGGRGAAVAVADAQADGAGGRRAGGGAAVGEVLDQRLDGLDGGAAAQVDAQRRAVGARARSDGADGGATVADRVAQHADLAEAVALVAHAELVGGLAELHVEQVDAAAGEVGRIGVVQADRGVDDLRRGVDQVLGEADAALEVAEHGVGLAGQLGRGAEQLLGDVVGGGGGAVGGGDVVAVGDDEVARAEVGDGGLVLGAVAAAGDELALAVDGHAGGAVLAHVDVAGGARATEVVVVVVPGDDEAAGGQAGDVGLVLAAGGGLVDQQLGPDLGAGGIEALGDDGGRGAVQGVIAPDDDEAAVGQGGHGRLVLVAGGGGVDEEGVRQRAGGGVEAAAIDAVQVAVVAALVGPDHDQVAVGVGGDVRCVLRARLGGAGRAGRGADARLGAHRGAGQVELAQVHIAGIDVQHGKAVGMACDHVVRLGAAGGGVDDEGGALRGTGRVVALCQHAEAGAVGAAGVVPGDDETAIAGGGDVRVVLGCLGDRVDPELAAERLAGAGKALGVDAGATAVLAGRGPGDDVTAVGQHRDVRGRLVARRVGGDRFVSVDDGHAVELIDDVDGDGACGGGTAVAIAHAQPEGAGGGGAGRVAGVGQVLHQRLDGLDRGTGVQVDAQRAAVGAAARRDRADGGAAVADHVAGHADLAEGVALVAHTELVGGFAVLHVEQVDAPAGEVGRVDVADADRRVDDLRRAVDQVLGEGDRAAEVAQRWVGLAYQFGGVAEDLLHDVVAGARRARVEVGVDDHVVAVAQVGDRRLELGAVGGRAELDLAGGGQAGGVVLAHVDVAGGAGAADVGVVVVPADDEAAGGQAGHRRLVLAAQGGLVDQELAARLDAVAVVALAVDAGAGAVLAVGAPDDDEAAVGQRGDLGFVLRAGGRGVDQEGVGEGARGGVVASTVDAPATAIVALLIGPHDHEVAVGVGGEGRVGLRAGLGHAGNRHAADAGFRRQFVAVGVEAPQVDVVAVATGVADG